MIVLNPSRPQLIAIATLLIVVAAIAGVSASTRPVRESVRAYTQLLGAANRDDAAAARLLCTTRYVQSHPLHSAPDGGLVGLPRNIHKNFQAWREGPFVWLCPTNRVGPVYQFVFEANAWKFDGPIGLLQPQGLVQRLDEADLIDTPAVPH